MSGLTPSHVDLFRRTLRGRGLTMADLAAQVGCARSRFSEIIWGHLKGGNWWAKIRACVTDAEWALLLHVENCATWNAAQLGRPADAQEWVLRVECGWCRAPMGFKTCLRTQATSVSHGICPTCYTSQLAELDALAARQVAQDVTADSFAALACVGGGR